MQLIGSKAAHVHVFLYSNLHKCMQQLPAVEPTASPIPAWRTATRTVTCNTCPYRHAPARTGTQQHAPARIYSAPSTGACVATHDPRHSLQPAVPCCAVRSAHRQHQAGATGRCRHRVLASYHLLAQLPQRHHRHAPPAQGQNHGRAHTRIAPRAAHHQWSGRWRASQDRGQVSLCFDGCIPVLSPPMMNKYTRARTLQEYGCRIGNR